MEDSVVTVLTAAGWIQGTQVTGDEVDTFLNERAGALQVTAKDLILLKNCLVQNHGNQRVGQIILRRSAVLGLFMDAST